MLPIQGWTKQEIYDVVGNHLLYQNRKSTAVGPSGYVGNKYHAEDVNGDTLKCAIGVLIPNDLYHPFMEGKEIGSASIIAALEAAGVGASHQRFLRELQSIHDVDEVRQWPAQLNRLARDYHLRDLAGVSYAKEKTFLDEEETRNVDASAA